MCYDNYTQLPSPDERLPKVPDDTAGLSLAFLYSSDLFPQTKTSTVIEKDVWDLKPL